MDYPILDVNWQRLSFGLLPSGGISSPPTPQVFRFEVATSLPDHRSCRYLDDFLYNVVIVKGPCWGPLHSSLRAFSLAINGNSGYLGASFRRECGWSFGLRLPSIHRRYLYRFSTVFPKMVPHPASRAFIVRFPFIDNLLIDALVCF